MVPRFWAALKIRGQPEIKVKVAPSAPRPVLEAASACLRIIEYFRACKLHPTATPSKTSFCIRWVGGRLVEVPGCRSRDRGSSPTRDRKKRKKESKIEEELEHQPTTQASHHQTTSSRERGRPGIEGRCPGASPFLLRTPRIALLNKATPASPFLYYLWLHVYYYIAALESILRWSINC